MMRKGTIGLILFGCFGCLSLQGKAATSNATVRCCGTVFVQDDDYLKILARRQKSNGEIARAYARLAQDDSRYTHRAISVHGHMPAVENLEFLYAFTNNLKYASHAALSIIMTLGISDNAMQVADHVISMKSVPSRDKVMICKAIAGMAGKSNVLIDDRLFVRNLLQEYAFKVEGAASCADEICLETSNVGQRGTHERRSDSSDLDKKIKDAFLMASDPAFCGDAPSLAYEYGLKRCGADNRRRARIAVEIAREHPNRVPWTLSELSVCGSSEDVPFIHEWTNDVRYVANAARALICIGGITGDAVACASAAMYRDELSPGKRYALCSALARMAKAEKGDQACKSLAVAALKRYSREIPVTSLWADEFLLSLDPAYETSEDRRTLLRQVAARRLNDYQVNYATNALNRINARLQADKVQGSEGKEY